MLSYYCLIVFLALQPTVVVFSQPPCFRDFLITHNDAPQSVGLLWTSDQSVAETSTWQHTTLTTDKTSMPPGGIRTHNLSKRAAEDPRLRPRCHWDRQMLSYWELISVCIRLTLFLLWESRFCPNRRHHLSPEPRFRRWITLYSETLQI